MNQPIWKFETGQWVRIIGPGPYTGEVRQIWGKAMGAPKCYGIMTKSGLLTWFRPTELSAATPEEIPAQAAPPAEGSK